MSYMALYRKFRPTVWDEVKGQDHIVTTLRNQILADRIGHAYLFVGTRGTGKTTVAKIMARTVNCPNSKDGNPCGECPSCKAIAAGNSMNVIEIDAASNNGVDSIREIVEEVTYAPVDAKYKVYIIDEVHMLTNNAFNALLKTLEEPPSYVIFILATTELHKIPVTILSRCQRYDFRRMSIETIVDRMKELTDTEKIQIEDKALKYVAKAADGSMRDALSLLDQCVAFNYGKELTFDKVLDVLGATDTDIFSAMIRKVAADDIIGCIDMLEQIIMQGREPGQFVTDFIWYLRNLMLLKASGTEGAEDVLGFSTENLAKLKEEADMLELSQIYRYINVFSELSNRIRFSTQKRVLIEMALIKLCCPQMDKMAGDEALQERIRAVEKKLEEGITVRAASMEEMPKKSKAPVILPEAMPEEIRKIAGEWPIVIDRTEHLTRALLEKVVPSLGEEGQLLLCTNDDMVLARLKNEGRLDDIKKVFSEFVEKDVKVELRGCNKDQDVNDVFADIRERVHFNVETE